MQSRRDGIGKPRTEVLGICRKMTESCKDGTSAEDILRVVLDVRFFQDEDEFIFK